MNFKEKISPATQNTLKHLSIIPLHPQSGYIGYTNLYFQGWYTVSLNQDGHSAFTKQQRYTLPTGLGAGSGADEGLLMLTTCLVILLAVTSAGLLAFSLTSFLS